MTPEFWEGRRTFVTGHTGFKGSWLCLWLESLGALTYGYALEPPTDPSLYEQAHVGGAVDSTIADIRDLSRLSDALDRAEPEIVFHLAAQPLVLQSYEDPVATYSTNVIGTVHVLEAVRRSGFSCAVVNVTTDKVYENKGLEIGYREGDELGGRDPYSSSKAGAELVARAYRDSFFSAEDTGGAKVSVASARAGNVIGGGDWTPHQLVPDAIRAMLGGSPVFLRHPEAVRPWQHVLDCLDGYLTLAERLHSDPDAYSGEWNFGPPGSECIRVSELVEGISMRLGLEHTWVQESGAHAHEEAVLRLDSGKAAKQLAWRTALPLAVALDWVVDWYRSHASGGDAQELCRAQIAAYMDMRSRGS
jgi:CDP-glucose 4,6-dehydratase